jgi:hypothetical protein
VAAPPNVAPVVRQLVQDRPQLRDARAPLLADEAALDQLHLGSVWHRHGRSTS